MKTLDGSEVAHFLQLLHELDVDMLTLSIVELDRYLEAYALGAHAPEALAKAVKEPVFPQLITLYAQLEAQDLHDLGQQVHLSEEANRVFSGKGPVKLGCRLNKDGSVDVTEVNDQILTAGIAL